MRPRCPCCIATLLTWRSALDGTRARRTKKRGVVVLRLRRYREEKSRARKYDGSSPGEKEIVVRIPLLVDGWEERDHERAVTLPCFSYSFCREEKREFSRDFSLFNYCGVQNGISCIVSPSNVYLRGRMFLRNCQFDHSPPECYRRNNLLSLSLFFVNSRIG